MAKKSEKSKKSESPSTEEEILNRPAKQSFVKITKNKNKDPRTWVVIYRLIDGPAIDPDRARKRQAAKKKKAAKSE